MIPPSKVESKNLENKKCRNLKYRKQKKRRVSIIISDDHERKLKEEVTFTLTLNLSFRYFYFRNVLLSRFLLSIKLGLTTQVSLSLVDYRGLIRIE